MRFQKLVVCAILATVVVADEEYSLKEYQEREVVIGRLQQFYDEYRSTYPGHREKKARLLQTYQNYFADEFNESDEWILEGIMSKPGLTQLTMTANGYDIAKTEAFLDSAIELYGDASLHRMRIEMHQGNSSEAVRLEEASEAAKITLQKQKMSTLNFIQSTAYKSQFKLDVQSLVKIHGSSMDLGSLVVSFLKKKFPFRSWVAVLFDPKTEKKICGDTFTVSTGKRNLFVLSVDSKAKSNKQRATVLFKRVEDSKHWLFHSCDDRGTEIMDDEAKYNCKSNEFTAAAVLETGNGLPKIESSDSTLINSKEVHRARFGWFCQANFLVLFLG